MRRRVRLPSRLSVSAAHRGLLADTGWMMVGFGMKIVVQAAFFIIIARSLHPAGYGAFVAVAAFIAVVAPFAGMGKGNLLVMHVARNRNEFARRWGDALVVTILSGSALALALLVLGRIVLPHAPILLTATIGAADLVFNRLLDISSQAFQATGNMRRASQLQVLPNLGKLVAACLLAITIATPTATLWAFFYLACAIVTGLVGVWLVSRQIGSPIFRLRQAFDETREGFHFSISLASQSIYNDIDKTMLGSLAAAAAVGTYAAAYRLIDVAFTPVRSLLFASYAGFFRAGEDGVRATTRYALKLVPLAWSYAALASVGLWVAAPIVPRILGSEYQSAVLALRWLSLLPLLKAMHYLAADALTGAGRQYLRTRAQLAIAMFNVAINFWLIPRYSWLGAAWASLVSDGLLAAMLWGTLVFLRNREGHGAIGAGTREALPNGAFASLDAEIS